jgi:hypothetical protein
MIKKAVLAVLLLAAIGGPAQATVMIDLDGPQLAKYSDAIVYARVISVKGFVRSDARVLTEAHLMVLESLKGIAAGQQIKVVYGGGEAMGLAMRLDGEVTLRENTDVVLYLRHGLTPDSWGPAAMRLGFFEIVRRPYDGVRIANRNTRGLDLAIRSPLPPMRTIVDSAPRITTAPLVDVMDAIRADILKQDGADLRMLGVAR